ncbi:MAG: Crp/Fnr family transcriptional regulator [Pelotomaculum sp.]|jgi:CRP/FNR family transcriptional regulator
MLALHDHQEYLQKHLTIWKKLEDRDKRELLAATSLVVYKQGEIILSKEKECNGLVLVKSGQLRAFFELEDGKEITLYRLLSNDICILTASCVIRNLTFDITLEAEKDSVLYIVSPVYWGHLTDKNPAVKDFSMELVSGRFSEVMWVMEQLITKNMRQRTASFLLEQSILEASDTLSMTHESIAKNLGTAREVISRILKYLENDGVIQLSRGRITIIDLKKLKEISN